MKLLLGVSSTSLSRWEFAAYPVTRRDGETIQAAAYCYAWRRVAALPGIDVVIAGHTHRVFPAPDHPAGPGIDLQAGTLAGKPAVMPGFWGSHLGVIDLGLMPDGEGWRIDSFRSRAEPVETHEDHPCLLYTSDAADE